MKKLAQYQITINFYNSIGPDDPKFYHWSDNYTILVMIFMKSGRMEIRDGGQTINDLNRV